MDLIDVAWAIEDDVPKDVVNALLRIADNVVMPATIYKKLAAEPFAAKQKKKSGFGGGRKNKTPWLCRLGSTTRPRYG